MNCPSNKEQFRAATEKASEALSKMTYEKRREAGEKAFDNFTKAAQLSEKLYKRFAANGQIEGAS